MILKENNTIYIIVLTENIDDDNILVKYASAFRGCSLIVDGQGKPIGMQMYKYNNNTDCLVAQCSATRSERVGY